jgi:hypothetical protein
MMKPASHRALRRQPGALSARTIDLERGVTPAITTDGVAVPAAFAGRYVSVVEIPPNIPDEIRVSVLIGYATGQVVRQADCEVIEAFDRLAGRARLLGQSLEHTALDVLDGVIRFDA